MYHVMRTRCSGLAPPARSTATTFGERLLELRHEVVALELAARVPADLAGHEQRAAFGGDAIGVAARRRPAVRLQEVEMRCGHGLSGMDAGSAGYAESRMRNRWIFPVAVFGSWSTN